MSEKCDLCEECISDRTIQRRAYLKQEVQAIGDVLAKMFPENFYPPTLLKFHYHHLETV